MPARRETKQSEERERERKRRERGKEEREKNKKKEARQTAWYEVMRSVPKNRKEHNKTIRD